MAKLLKGAPVAATISEAAAKKADALIKRGVFPTLAIVRLGERPGDVSYEKGATSRCEKTGVAVRHIALPADTPQERLIEEIKTLNDDLTVHGVLLFRPLPAGMNDDAVRNTLSPEKDPDGITDIALAGVFTGARTGFAPCTAVACTEILKHYGVDPKGKRAVVVGRSLVIGRPVAMMLLAAHATVTICHTRTENMPAICKDADILIVCAGRANAVDGRYLSEGQVIIDVGVNEDENGVLCGDVNLNEAVEIVGAITPVPGGVGAVTSSILAKHVVTAAKKAAEAEGVLI
ncbi:MAG: bifunctional 5,10-methylene-tetrahydrofolate dehydrogenase/5,10-methylene-tetrahydrofolate cyclohydrolase [Clostridiales Family XIII bacterium]|nr:bifunctional 5,10-methylene-tetrahydrofolate dehydrogenase/5,10-methylene-tetrahydrofolate cyclohydrolase [Clostridiales Family XIII bacterium]